jgi:glycosyltransferase involved in cell wall biosynthesis
MKNSKNKNITVLSLDPRGIVLSDPLVTASRQYEYAKNLSKLDNDFRYIVFSSYNGSHKDVKRVQFEIINLYHKTFNSLVFAYLSYKKIVDRSLDVKLIVVGDPWESYWSAFFLNKFLKSKIPIQIHVHGDIANPRWRKINFKNRFRFFLAKSSLNRCEVIRCVSKEQKLNLVKFFGLDKRKIIVIPVPIKVVNKPLVPRKRPRTIGFIGRIHEDRGIWNFIKLVKNLNELDTGFKLLIAGDGPARDEFILQLEIVIEKNRIKYLGQISQGKLRSSWKSIGVLLSMAPVESYGRVLRESLLAGVPVWATASSGVIDLLENAEPGTVKVLDLEKDESGLHEDFESLLKVKVGPKFRDKFIKENNFYSDKLAKSWIDTIENFKK